MNNSVNIYLNKQESKEKDTKENEGSKLEVSPEVKLLQEQIDQKVEEMPTEYGGRSKEKGLEPTRYGDWELKGRCVDF
ncbi:MAG: DUF1674 domain-containing protein [Gammaproteobacteria bacterium]|nr:DUF1674 domain-containing protein [Gammaproteobacteria bacterium]